jgi:molecular chaperone DnaK
VPKIQVTFRINADGLLSVEAKDLGTEIAHEVKVTPSSGLTEVEVERLVDDASRHVEEDKQRKEFAQLRNQAEALIYTTENALRGYADFFGEDQLQAVREDLASLKAAVEGGSDMEAIRGSYARLENSTFEIAEALYGTEDGTEDQS